MFILLEYEMSFNELLSGNNKTNQIYQRLAEDYPSESNLLQKSCYGKRQGIELINLGRRIGKEETAKSILNEV